MKKINKVLIIAEIGVNHNGKLSLAKKLIRKAAEAGAAARPRAGPARVGRGEASDGRHDRQDSPGRHRRGLR